MYDFYLVYILVASTGRELFGRYQAITRKHENEEGRLLHDDTSILPQ